jgi:hypothetical protein
MHRTSFRTIFSTVLVTAIALTAFAIPASGSGKTAAFCKDAEGVSVVLSPTLPSGDSLNAIASAVAKLPSDITALKKIHMKLSASVAATSNAAVAAVLRDAATSVVKESTALTGAVDEESAVLFDPQNSIAVMDLAKDLIAAFSAAAAANAYLTVGRPTIAELCKSAS